MSGYYVLSALLFAGSVSSFVVGVEALRGKHNYKRGSEKVIQVEVKRV
jgi:hypothetical protein